MRLPRQSLLLLLLLITLGLLFGVMFGIISGYFMLKPVQASPTATRVTPTTASPPLITATPAPLLPNNPSAQQMALLILGVSDKNALQPKLEGCWVVAFSTGINDYYVVSFLPEAHFQEATLGNDQTLADIYLQDVQQEVGYRFTREAIQSALPGMTIQTVVTVDRSDVVDLVSKLGGVAVAGKLLEGAAMLATYDTVSFNGSAARIDFQQQAFQAVFHELTDQHWTPQSIAVYLEGLPNAVRPEDARALPIMANSAPALQLDELRWAGDGSHRAAVSAP